MLLACRELGGAERGAAALEQIIRSQRACLDFRQRHLDLADDVGPEAARLVEDAQSGRLLSRWTSASTVHTSVVDDSGNGCDPERERRANRVGPR